MSHLVFAGGGHAHLTALRDSASLVRDGHRVTLISPDACHDYSGMGPGMLAGHYRPREISFHVQRLVEDRGGRFIEDRITEIDPVNQQLRLQRSSETISYDLISFNVGSEIPGTWPGDTEIAVFPVKPIQNLRRARGALIEKLRSTGRARVTVVGGGPAALEISGALLSLASDGGGELELVVAAGRRFMKRFPGTVRKAALRSLEARGAEVREGVRMEAVGKREVRFSDGSELRPDFLFFCTGVRPSPLFRSSGLPVGPDGGLLVNRHLQSVAHPQIFGGGDCIHLEGHSLDRVGVFAVRQNPILRDNLNASLKGGALTPFDPGGPYLLLFSLGDGRAIFHRNGTVFQGRLAFRLKDWIDRRFMKTYQLSGERSETANVADPHRGRE